MITAARFRFSRNACIKPFEETVGPYALSCCRTKPTGTPLAKRSSMCYTRWFPGWNDMRKTYRRGREDPTLTTKTQRHKGPKVRLGRSQYAHSVVPFS